jgi:DNA-binding response OmpR family regulator
MPDATIMTIEDDTAIRRGIVDALSFAGYRVIECGRGDEGCRQAVARAYDLLLLDMVLPGMTGLDILRRVREVHPTLPVIILSAKGEEQDRVSGLQLGADDYVVKPFSVRELLARVTAVLRRSPGRPSDVDRVELATGQIDFARAEMVFRDGTRCELSERELALVRYLAKNAYRAVSREELLAGVWQIEGCRTTTRTIDMHVARLREKLRDSGAIATVRGKGYMLSPVSATPPCGEER